VGFVTIFEGSINDFRDFLSRPDKYLTMDGKAIREPSYLRENASACKPLAWGRLPSSFRYSLYVIGYLLNIIRFTSFVISYLLYVIRS
jgi:hypothetical protein